MILFYATLALAVTGAAPPALAFHTGFALNSVLRHGIINSDRWHDKTRHDFKSSKQISLSTTALCMAFQIKEGEKSNMFDGPMSLVKERDACGVGFICNGKSGGEMKTIAAAGAIILV